jgi:uncharacterized membrane protein
MSIYEKGLITMLCCALLFTVLAVPLILRKVPRNIVYGFRTRKTLGDDFIWYEVNAHFGRGLFIAGIATALAALMLYWMRGPSPGFFLNASIGVLVVPPLVATVATLRFMRSLTPGGPSSRPRG